MGAKFVIILSLVAKASESVRVEVATMTASGVLVIASLLVMAVAEAVAELVEITPIGAPEAPMGCVAPHAIVRTMRKQKGARTFFTI